MTECAGGPAAARRERVSPAFTSERHRVPARRGSTRAQHGSGPSMTDGRKAVCVIGWPIAHSRSPLIHNYWIKQHGLDAEYRREAVPPGEFEAFAARLRERGYIGANVTVPHKQAALNVASPDDRARAVGAATPGWDRGLESAIVLGAGGGARAVVFALLSRDVERVYVINRSPERAAAL